MKLLSITIVYFALSLHECMSYYYPPLFWQKDNCAFKRWQKNTDPNITKEHFIKVLPNNGMNVVCPNYGTINNWLEEDVSDGSLLENMWLVDKEGYDKCQVNEKGDPNFNKLIMVCDQQNEIDYKLFAFHPRYNVEEPRFAPGQHYYFISTSRGYRDELRSRKVSGPIGSCERNHMKLHIYVCDPKIEDCIWEMPRCGPPEELYRDMIMIDGKLPAPTQPPVVRPKTQKSEVTSTSSRPREKSITILRDQKLRDLDNSGETSRRDKTAPVHEKRERICAKKTKETSIHLVLNFVLGGVTLFMAIVIVILACGLAKKSQGYNVDRPIYTSASLYEPTKDTYVETVRYGEIQPEIPHGNRPPVKSPHSGTLQLLPKATYALENAPQQTPQTIERQIFTYPDVPGIDKTTKHI